MESLIIQPIYKSIFASPCPFLKRQEIAAAGLAQGFHTALSLQEQEATSGQLLLLGGRWGMGGELGWTPDLVISCYCCWAGAETQTLHHQLGSPKHWWRVYCIKLPTLPSMWSSHSSWKDEQNLRLTTPLLHFAICKTRRSDLRTNISPDYF